MVRMIVMMRMVRIRRMKNVNRWVKTNCWQRCHLKRSTIWSPFIINTQHCFENFHQHSDFQAKKPQKNPPSRLVGGSLLTMEEDTAIGFARTVKSWLKSASRYHYQLYKYVSIFSYPFFTAISPRPQYLTLVVPFNGCNTVRAAKELSSWQTEPGRAPSLQAPSGPGTPFQLVLKLMEDICRCWYFKVVLRIFSTWHVCTFSNYQFLPGQLELWPGNPIPPSSAWTFWLRRESC